MKKSRRLYAIISILFLCLLIILAGKFLIDDPSVKNLYLEHENHLLKQEVDQTAAEIESEKKQLQEKRLKEEEKEMEETDIFIEKHTYPEHGGKAPDVY